MVASIFVTNENSSGFSSGSNEWRNTCTNCRCSRMCHDISIGANCCGIDRIGFEPTYISNHDNSTDGGPQVNGKVGTCHRTILAEAEGYSWIPPVSDLRLSEFSTFLIFNDKLGGLKTYCLVGLWRSVIPPQIFWAFNCKKTLENLFDIPLLTSRVLQQLLNTGPLNFSQALGIRATLCLEGLGKHWFSVRAPF